MHIDNDHILPEMTDNFNQKGHYNNIFLILRNSELFEASL